MRQSLKVREVFYDVLASLPGVVIDSNGNILLNGQSGATILMDGKPTYLREMN